MKALLVLRGAASLLALSLAPTARATGDDGAAKSACFEAHEQGQLSRNRGQLRAARESFLRCSSEGCPDLVRKDCLQWAEQVVQAQPTVVVAATDAQGRDLIQVRCFVDDVLIADQLTGAPFVLDPGEHRFRFEAAGAPAVERVVVLREGEKDRRLALQFATAKNPPSAAMSSPAPIADADHRSSVSPLTYALAGVSLTAFGVFGYFASAGKSLEHERAATCSPRCSPDSVAPVKRDYAVADVALGIGLVSGSLAVWSLLAASEPATPSAGGLRLTATPFGARLLFEGELPSP